MPTPDLALAAYSSGVTSTQLLIQIIHTTQQVRRLKAECEEVRTISSKLQELLRANEEVLKDENTATQLNGILLEVLKFTAECSGSNIVNRAWEVLWKYKLPGLLKDMMTWVVLLNTGTSVSTRTAVSKLDTKTEASQAQQQRDMETILEKLQILDELKKNQDEEKAPQLRVDFPEQDVRLQVTRENDGLFSGSLADADFGITKVVCEPVKEDLMKYGEKGPRHVLIYAKLSANTLVHPFYGIAQRSNQRWIVMKDLRHCPTLRDMMRDGKVPKSVLERMSIACDIARTMEYLHSVEILVKRLSDTTILLSRENNVAIPYLTNIDSARLFMENTSGGSYDVRFEAPEFQKLPHQQHSIYTDIWSLGILVWQCVSGTFPFDSSDEVFEGPEAERIHALISRGEMSWNKNEKYDNPLFQEVLRVVQSCCNARPTIRPSAAGVAHSLFDILTCAAIGIESPAKINGLIKIRVSDLLDTIDKKTGRSSTGQKLSAEEAGDLQALAEQGDPTAAFLFGSAIWYRLVEIQDDLDEMLLVDREEMSTGVRARATLKHLDFAFQAGVKAAGETLMRVHHALAGLYRKQALQYRNMHSI